MRLPAERELKDLLEKKALDGAFFLHGDAARLRDEGARSLIEAATDPATRDFNVDLFRGDDVEPEELASVLAMPPMMAERRAVAVLAAQNLTRTGREVVQRVVERPPPGLTLVVTARIPDRSRAAFYGTLKEKARSLEWKLPRESEVPGWLIERAGSRYGVRLSGRAAQRLASAVGSNLDLMDAELEKLAGAGEGKEITVGDVERLVPSRRAVDRWEWLDGVARREYVPALRNLPRLLADSSESAVGLLIGMIDQHLYLGLALASGEGGVRDALSKAGKPYLRWKARIYARQAGSWSASQLERALRLMRRADRSVKSGAGDRRALEELLLSLHMLRKRAA